MKSNRNYSNIEKKIALLLIQFPQLKSNIKKIYQKINYIIYKKPYNFKSGYKIQRLSLDNKESYFGYYDKSPINSTNEYIIFQSTNINTKNIPDPTVPVDIVLYNVIHKTYEIAGKSHTYNWQQGTRLMWIDKYKFIYNDFDSVGNKYLSKIYDLKSKETKFIDLPIYDCFEDQFAISLNFERLNIIRTDYSYSNLGDDIDWKNNSNDGLFYIDLQNNTSKPIITLQDIIKLQYKETMKFAKHKFNHIMISPDGSKMMFMHRWFLQNGRRYDTLYIADIAGTNIKVVADDDMVSHCYWYNENHIFSYLRDKKMGDKYYIIDVINGVKEIVGEGIIDKFGDGHPHINSSNIIFDTYPDKARMKNLFMYDCDSKKLEKLGEFFESFDYYNETRCDLHPRYSYDGKQVFFDSVHTGKRQLYMMDLN